MAKQRPNPAQKVVQHDAGIPAEIRGVFQRAGVHIKPHSHLDIVTTLIGERSDGQGSIAQAMIVVDWRTLSEQQYIDWLRACADDAERARDQRRQQQLDPPVM